MATPTKTDLMNFSTYVISASMVTLKNDGIDSVPIQRASGSLTSPHVELSLLINAPTGHSHVSGSVAEYDAWHFSLRGLVVTNRQVNDVTHSLYTSKVLNKLGDPRNYSMPFHAVTTIKPTQIVTGFDAANSLDHSTIYLDGQVWIKPEYYLV